MENTIHTEHYNVESGALDYTSSVNGELEILCSQKTFKQIELNLN
mgnify:CR=1 FL=1